jgi:hypothetical protein
MFFAEHEQPRILSNAKLSNISETPKELEEK